VQNKIGAGPCDTGANTHLPVTATYGRNRKGKQMSTMTMQQAAALIAQLQTQNAALQSKVDQMTNRKVTVRPNVIGGFDKEGNPNKGTVSVLGLNGKWPVTLYPNQWEKLFEAIPAIKATLEANREKLSWQKND